MSARTVDNQTLHHDLPIEKHRTTYFPVLTSHPSSLKPCSFIYNPQQIKQDILTTYNWTLYTEFTVGSGRSDKIVFHIPWMPFTVKYSLIQCIWRAELPLLVYIITRVIFIKLLTSHLRALWPVSVAKRFMVCTNENNPVQIPKCMWKVIKTN